MEWKSDQIRKNQIIKPTEYFCFATIKPISYSYPKSTLRLGVHYGENCLIEDSIANVFACFCICRNLWFTAYTCQIPVKFIIMTYFKMLGIRISREVTALTYQLCLGLIVVSTS